MRPAPSFASTGSRHVAILDDDCAAAASDALTRCPADRPSLRAISAVAHARTLRSPPLDAHLRARPRYVTCLSFRPTMAARSSSRACRDLARRGWDECSPQAEKSDTSNEPFNLSPVPRLGSGPDEALVRVPQRGNGSPAPARARAGAPVRLPTRARTTSCRSRDDFYNTFNTWRGFTRSRGKARARQGATRCLLCTMVRPNVSEVTSSSSSASRLPSSAAGSVSTGASTSQTCSTSRH